jgi:hypothetical protein
VTVYEAFNLVRPKIVLGNIENNGTAAELCCWLHALSRDNMVRLYGANFGFHEDLPPDIDKATSLTVEEECEFYGRFRQLTSKFRSIDDDWVAFSE